MTGARVCVVIPTFRRVGRLQAAVRSVFAQAGIEEIQPDIVVVDNDPEGSALAPARALASEAPDAVNMIVIHCPEPGVANARNAAIAAVRSPLVAFLDDDQTACPDWLGKLLQAHDTWNAAVTFGPVDTALPAGVSRHRAYFENFFARTPDHEDGLISTYYGCGNALLDLEQLPAQRPLFDARMNEVGGEDDVLFARAEAAGCRFAWAGSARVWEHVPESRARLGYTLARAIGYGQGPTRKAEETRNWPQLVLWICVGAVQALGFGLLAAFGWLTGSSHKAFWLDRAAQGFGKVFWRWAFRFYGASQVPRGSRSDQAGGLAAKTQA